MGILNKAKQAVSSPSGALETLQTGGMNIAGGVAADKLGNAWREATGAKQAKEARESAKEAADRLQETGMSQAEAMRYQADKMEGIADRQIDVAKDRAELGREALEFGKDRWQDYRDLYRPTEKAMLDMAEGGPDYDQAVSRAMGDVATAQGNEMAQAGRMAQRYGMNPNSGKFAEAMSDSSLAQAGQRAQAATSARRQEEQDAFNMKSTALGRGQYLPGMAQQGFSQGQSGFAGQSASLGAAGQAMQGAGNLQQGALSGVQSATQALGNIYNSAEGARQFNTQAILSGASQLGKGIGSYMGGGASGSGVQGMAEGGEVNTDQARQMAMDDTGRPVSGEVIKGPGSGKSDSVPGAAVDAQGNSAPVALSDGEYVMPVEAVKFHGIDKLDKMVQKAQEAMQGRAQ